MLEQELKLSIPSVSRKAVAAQIATLNPPPRVRLRAMYFDTADRQLARRQAAIRLRQEGRRWVQTFKMAGADAMTRIELNHPCPKRQLDLSVYAGTPAEAVLAGLSGELQVRYETDVWRRAARVRTRGGTAEVAYDEGVIRAGGLELPICELEFELASGRPEALFNLARRWQRQHGLVLDVRSKAERGDSLANAAVRIAAAPLDEQPAVRDQEIARFWAPRMAAGVTLGKHAPPAEALRAITAECFDQIVRNAASLAAVDAPPGIVQEGAEHVHQLRVGMRRLRSAWRLFDGMAALPPEAMQAQARKLFNDFGQLRDRDVMEGAVLPALLAAGMPPLPPSQAAGDGDDGLAGSAAFQGWLLDLLAWNVGASETPARPAGARPAASTIAPVRIIPAAGGSAPEAVTPAAGPVEPAPARPARLARSLTPRLRKWHRKLVREGARFSQLDDERRHSLRKLAKRLRYGLSLSQSLYPANAVRGYRKKLAALQDLLGEFNDLVVAREHYAGLAKEHSQAWFALGWIAARLKELEVLAENAFKGLAEVAKPWK